MASETELDEIFRVFDQFMNKGYFRSLDYLLEHTTANDVDVLLAFLVASLPVKSRLPSRPALLKRVSDEYGEDLVVGL